MIWSIDQDDAGNTSTDNLLGIGTSNGVSQSLKAQIRSGLISADQASQIANSCYWSFCDGTCTGGYFETTQARGIVGGINLDYECVAPAAKKLCCASGTTTGQCAWNGWRGVGMPCNNTCASGTAIAVAGNTNNFENTDQTCNGGTQLYCCEGFKPSMKTNTNNLVLLGQGAFAKRSVIPREIAERAIGPRAANSACMTASAIATVLSATVAALTSAFTFGLGGAVALGVGSLVYQTCVTTVQSSAANAPIGAIALGVQLRGGKILGLGGTNANPNQPAAPVMVQPVLGKPQTAAGMVGQYNRVTYTSGTTNCAVTYTCMYGRGYDEICDNQRWGIDSLLGGNTVYNYVGRDAILGANGNAIVKARSQADYPRYRDGFYRSLAGPSLTNRGRFRCEADEFPMGALEESRKPNPQVVRFVNGPANGLQGRDFQDFITAKWTPCSALRRANKVFPPGPPITWEFLNSASGSRGIAAANGNHFIQKYGFDSQTPGSECFATYDHPSTAGRRVTVLDHGFRALPDDPMFNIKGWPLQDYRNYFTRGLGLGGPLNNVFNPATDVASANWLKRREVQSILEGKLEVLEIDLNGTSVDDWLEKRHQEAFPHRTSPKPTLAEATLLPETAVREVDSSPARSPVTESRPVETGSEHLAEHIRRHNHHLHHGA